MNHPGTLLTGFNGTNARLDLASAPITLAQCIGKGTFGKVYSASIGTQTFAVKRVVLAPGFIDRELAILQLLMQHPHPNTVALRGAYREQDAGDTVHFYIMDLFPMTLADLLEMSRQRGRSSQSKTKLFSYQLLRAVGHIHGLGIAHRDIKPQNALINLTTGVLVLADFGSAKLLHGNDTHTSYISSRFYRAPECMLENEHYTCAIDLWAVGCVIAEMQALRPLFLGTDTVDQLYLMFKSMGTPTEEDFQQLKPGLEPEVIDRMLRTPNTRRCWHRLLKTSTSENYNRLLDGLLQWNPNARLLPLKALALPYFDTIRRLSPSQQATIGCNLFDFTNEEVDRIVYTHIYLHYILIHMFMHTSEHCLCTGRQGRFQIANEECEGRSTHKPTKNKESCPSSSRRQPGRRGGTVTSCSVAPRTSPALSSTTATAAN